MSKKAEQAKDYTFFHERLDPLGWTPENGRFTYTWKKVDGTEVNEVQELFDVDEEGNLLINYYLPTGARATYKRNEGPARNYQVVRWVAPRVHSDGRVEKYKAPAGTRTLPWLSLPVLQAVMHERPIDTLVLVEGVLKAFAASVHGAHMIGLQGIQNLKDRNVGTLHPEVLQVLRRCKPTNVVLLHDGDCRRLSTKWPENANTDLYERPNSFFTSVRTTGELLKDHARTLGFRAYYMHVVSESIEVPPGVESPKGLDDLMVTLPLALAHKEVPPPNPVLRTKYADEAAYEAAKDEALKQLEQRRATWARQHALEAAKSVVDDLLTFSAPCRYFERRDLDRPDKLRDYFHLRSADMFYNAYQEEIGEREFIYDGTKYQWDSNEKALKVKVPSTAKKYVRVGTDYYKYIKRRNPHSRQLEEFLAPWKKGAIVDDNGKHMINHIERFDTFTNWPDHLAHQAVMDSCLNAYAPFMHRPDDDAEPPETTLKFMRHVFGDGEVEVPHPKREGELIRVKEVDLGLDYLKLLYEHPTQMLPIMCLVSKERGTGKTTWFNYLKHLFGANCTQIGAKDLEGDFNAHYASKLLVIIDEALISKQESVEKLKHLSTSKNIMVNNKGIAQYEQPFFGKFLIASNNIRNFIRTDDDEVRFWIRKLRPIPAAQLDLDVEAKMVEEVPAMLSYLRKRPFATEKLFRSWFHPPLLVTQALIDIRKHSTPTAKREIVGWVSGMFHAMPQLNTLLMTAEDVLKEVFPGNRSMNRKYVSDVLREDMGLLKYGEQVQFDGNGKTIPYTYYRIAEQRTAEGAEDVIQTVQRKQAGRPFVFNRRDFVTAEQDDMTRRELVAPVVLSTTAAAAVGVGADDDSDLPF